MEYAIEYPKEEKIKRRDDLIWLKNDYANNYFIDYTLIVNKDERIRPIINCYLDDFFNNENHLKEHKHIEYIILFLTHYDELCQINKMDEFLQSEFLKVVYDHIKLELAYNRYESKLLNFIIENNFKINEFNDMVKYDIDKINRSTYVDSEMLEYFKRMLKTHNELLNVNVIRSIVMCTNYELIRNASKNRLKSNFQNTKSTLKDLKLNLKYLLIDKKNKIKECRNEYKKIIKKKNIVISLAILIIISASFGATKLVEPRLKTTYMTYSNVSSPTITEDYELKIDDNTPTLKIYSEAYLEDGIFYRDIETYKVEDFTSTSALEEYYNYDFSIIEPINIDKKVIVNDNELKQEYREVLKIYQDENDEIKINNDLGCVLSIIVMTALLSAVPLIPVAAVIDKTNFDIEEIKMKYYPIFVEAQRLITKLKESGEDIGKFLKESVLLCDELIGSEDISSLSEECQSLIKEYENFRNEHAELIEQITNDEINEYIKKYEKKMR